MGQLQIVVGDHSQYGDGDIIVAKSEAHALAVAADRFVGWAQAGTNSDGYRPRGTLVERFHELVDQFRAERTAPGELTVRNQFTGEERVLPLGGQAVRERLARLLRKEDGTPNPKHLVFGRKGSEVFFWGRQRGWRRDTTRLSTLWDEIEARTAYRRADYQRFDFGNPDDPNNDDFRHFLVVECEPITPQQASALVAPVLDGAGEILHQRRWWIDWRPLVTAMGVSVDDVLDPTVSVDVRPLQPRPVRQSDLQDRTA